MSCFFRSNMRVVFLNRMAGLNPFSNGEVYWTLSWMSGMPSLSHEVHVHARQGRPRHQDDKGVQVILLSLIIVAS